MPNFKLSDDDCPRHLGIPDRQQHAGCRVTRHRVSTKAAADPAAGASLYGESFCASCHAVQNAAGNMVGGDVGPELTRVGNQSEAGVAAGLVAQSPRLRSGHGHAALPLQRWPGRDALGIPAGEDGFRLCSPTSTSTPQRPSRSPTASAWSRITAALPATKLPESRSPRTSRRNSAASAASQSRSLSSSPGMQHTLPDYIAGKIKNPRAFSPGLKMPQYTFTPPQIDSLTTALLSLNDRSYALPASLAVPARA